MRNLRTLFTAMVVTIAVAGAFSARAGKAASLYYVNGANWASSSNFTVVAAPQGSCGASGALACSVTANGSYSVGQSIPKTDITAHTTRP